MVLDWWYFPPHITEEIVYEPLFKDILPVEFAGTLIL